jgi:hypothetical protein
VPTYYDCPSLELLAVPSPRVQNLNVSECFEHLAREAMKRAVAADPKKAGAAKKSEAVDVSSSAATTSEQKPCGGCEVQ